MHPLKSCIHLRIVPLAIPRAGRGTVASAEVAPARTHNRPGAIFKQSEIEIIEQLTSFRFAFNYILIGYLLHADAPEQWRGLPLPRLNFCDN